MRVALIVLAVLGLLVGLIISLRRTTRTGMPPQEVLKRATDRARDIEREENAQRK